MADKRLDDPPADPTDDKQDDEQSKTKENDKGLQGTSTVPLVAEIT